MCGHRQTNDRLKIASSQSVGSNRPSRTTNPAGVCIQEFAAMIQVEDRIVPIDTITDEANIVACRTRPSPYSRTPMNPASTKNAVTTSMPMIGPMTGPVFAAYPPQFRPISKVITIPATTPIANPTAKMRRQNRNSCR